MANIIDTDAKIISADHFGFGQPALCRCSSTLMFAAHINDSSELEIHKSINDGLNWTVVKTFTETDPGDFEMAAIDLTSAAIIFVYGSFSMRTYVTEDSGTTWISRYYWASFEYKKVNIAYDPIEDRLWLGFVYSTFMRLRYSDNKGVNWTAKEVIEGGNRQANDMDINPLNSKVYVVGTKSTFGEGKRHIYSKTGDYESVDSLGSSQFYDTCIVIDSAGNDYIITGYEHTDSKYYLAYAKNGVLDTSNFLLGSGTEVDYDDLVIPGSLSIAVDGNDTIYAFYTKVSDEKCYYRKYNGSSWESEVELIADANDRISTEKRPIVDSNKLNYVYYKAP